mmetsp:Transcript_42597/g.79959  ORF Transcript_42597/g.79959 Transcript_42597/m.79959 type:complete len:181 (+) Transcript_42597:2-544(+)
MGMGGMGGCGGMAMTMTPWGPCALVPIHGMQNNTGQGTQSGVGDWVCPPDSDSAAAAAIPVATPVGTFSSDEAGADENAGVHSLGEAKSDWSCLKCGNYNYGSREVCNTRTCRAPRPDMTPRGMSSTAQVPKPGDWACPQCGNLNYQKRDVCNTRTCRYPRPPDAGLDLGLPLSPVDLGG